MFPATTHSAAQYVGRVPSIGFCTNKQASHLKCSMCGSKWRHLVPHIRVSPTKTNHPLRSNEEVTDTAWARDHPDFQDETSPYWINEDARLLLSQNWDQMYERSQRDVSVEMALVRDARRKRNKLRREGVARARTGVAELDPTVGWNK
jgi:hypothetical protein